MKNKSFLAIIFISIILFIGLIFSIYKLITKKTESFYTNGYVSVSDVESSKRIYFSEGTAYKRDYTKDIVFKDADDVKQEASKYSFVFFSDKSINYLTDGVLMDLGSLAGTFIPYYNIKSNYLIAYKDGKYIIDSKDKDIILDNFIGKINDNKYLVAGNDLKLKVSSSDELITNYYFELNFGEGNLVKIDNDKISLETISDESYIMVGENIKIDLSKGIILYDDEVKANLSEIIINHDENIDIAYDDNTIINNEEDNTGDSENGDNTTNVGNVTVPTVETEYEYKTETVIEYKNVPYVELVSSSVNSHKVSLDFKVNDINKLITGALKVKYVDLSTGDTYEKDYSNYSGTIEFVADDLKSDNDYLVTISASYIRNGNIYRDYNMFQRVFSTRNIGVSLEKDYVTSSEIGYNIEFSDDATFTKATLNLYDNNGNQVDSFEFTNNHQPLSVIFDSLDSNKKYTAKIENISFGNVVYTGGTAAESSSMTLKHNPFKDSGIVASPVAVINKKDYSVKFDLGVINDEDSIIKTITYNIYDKETNEIIDTIKKDNLNSFDVKVEDKIKAYKTYYYKAVIAMQDNEKIVEYETLNSNDFRMDAKTSPTMRFVTNSLTANTANGYFIITDEDNTIDINQSVYVEYVSSMGESETKSLAYTNCPDGSSATSKCVNLELDNLNSDDIYTVSLMAYIDLKESEKEPGIDQVGAIKINTQKADVINTNMTANELEETEAIEKIFEVNINFSLEDGASEFIKTNMSSFDIRLYEGSDATGNFLSSIHVGSSTNIASEYFDNTKVLTLSDFGLTLEDLQRLHITEGGQISKRYTIRLSNGISGSDYVEFRPYSITFDINDVLIGLSNNDATIEVTPILNNEAANYHNNNLNENTIVGFKVIPNFGNKKFVTNINFTISDILETNSSININKKIDLGEGSIIPTYDFMFDDYSDFLKRGRIYKIAYTLDLDLNGDEQTDLVYPFLSGDINTPNPVVSSAIEAPKQEPSMILFPWTSDESSVIYKYSITDVDNALPNDFKVNYSINDANYEAEDAVCNNPNGVRGYTSNYDCMKIHSLSAKDNYEIFLKPILLENDDASRVSINNYVFEGITDIGNVSYALELNEENNPKYNNIFSVKLSDLDENNAYLNRIAYYTLEFSIENGSKKFRIDNINGSNTTSPLSSNIITYLENNREVVSWTSANRTDSLSKVAYVSTCEDETNLCLYVDYSKLYTSNNFKTYFNNFKNKNISVNISAAYDSGKIAYDAAVQNQKYAFQIVSSDEIIRNNEVYNNRYLILYGSTSDRINYLPSALSAAYAYANSQGGFVDDADSDKNIGSGNLYLINTIYSNLTTNQSSNFIRLNYLVTRNGIEVNLGTGANQITVPIVAKALSTSVLSGTAEFSYEKVIPALNVMGKTPIINGIKLDLQLLGITDADINEEDSNRYLYLEIYNSSENLVKTLKINKENLQSEQGKVSNNRYHISLDDDYKVDVTSISSASELPEYTYDYKTGNIVFKDDVPDDTLITVNYRLVIDNLNHNEVYHLKAYVNMENGSKTYLAGNNSTYATFNYEFNTKDTSNVIINNASFDVLSNANYQKRNLETNYTIDDIVGIDSLSYEVCNEDNTICVDTSRYESCDISYNNYAGTCFNKNGATYNAHVSNDISISDDLDAIFGSNYNLVIKAKTTESDQTNEYEIYRSSLPLRSLNMPTVNVTKRSGFKDNKKPYLSFDVTFTDNDRVISKPDSNKENGQYIVYLANGPEKVKVVGSEKILNVTDGTNDITSIVTYENLTPSSEYYLIVEYKTYANNAGQTASISYSVPYLIFTLDDNGISIGKMEYQALPTTTILKFGYASNITRDYITLDDGSLIADPNQEAYVAGITYTITRNSGDNLFRINDTVIFDETNPIEHKNDNSSKETVGDDYYQITLNNTVYQVVAGYNIIFRFYLGGQEASRYTTEDACKNANISNYWNAILNECYILDDANYSGYTLYEGGSAA